MSSAAGYHLHSGVTVREEHFATLILLGNGQRYEIDPDCGEILKAAVLQPKPAHRSATAKALLQELERLGVVARGASANGGRIITNPLVSEGCLSFPRTIYLECTSSCNLQCVHCYSSAGARSHRRLAFPVLKRLVAEMARYGAEFLSIGGGEPLMYPDIFRLIRECRDKQIQVEVTTNGTLLNTKTAGKLVDAGLRFLQVSIDGASPQTYASIRRGAPFEKVLTNLRALPRQLKLSICTVAMKSNISEIPQIIDLARDLEAKFYRVIPLMNVGRAAEGGGLGASPEDCARLYRYLQRRRMSETAINIQLNENIIVPKQKNIFWMPEGQFGCSAGRSTCGIDASGNVYPCSYMNMPDLACGNIGNRSLREIWAQSEVLRSIREINRIDGKCKTCHHLKKCRGGCRAAALLGTGNLGGADPLCTVGVLR